jgi:hypothetical protein
MAMNKQQIIKSISFGDRVAENEATTLKNYFVDTDQWRQVFSGDKDVVYGPKGSGKSAIYLLLQESSDQLFDQSIVFVPAENPRGATAFSQVAADPPTSEIEFTRLWKLYLLTLVGQAFEDHDITNENARIVQKELTAAGLLSKTASLRDRLAAAKQYVKSWMQVEAIQGTVELDPVTQMPSGLTGRIVFGTPTAEQTKHGVFSVDRLFDIANAALEREDFHVWLGIDRLDVAFAENEQLEGNALRALFRTYLDLQNCDRVVLKIFLRSDIWTRITEAGFREASHITRGLTISWSADLLLNLILRRMLQSELLLKAYNIDQEQVLSDIGAQREVFYRVFPKQVDVGEKKPSTFDWMLSRTRDGTNYTAPRELIHLLNSITELQLRKMEIGAEDPSEDILFSRQVIKEALAPVSKVRLEQTLYSEYPSLKNYMEQLEHAKATQTVASLQVIWKTDVEETLALAEKLVDVGFFERRGSREEPQFWVPFLYRDSLSLVQGVADD